MKKLVPTILLATVWIGSSEFERNEILFEHPSVDRYATLGLTFHCGPVNGAVWGIYSLLALLTIAPEVGPQSCSNLLVMVSPEGGTLNFSSDRDDIHRSGPQGARIADLPGRQQPS